MSSAIRIAILPHAVGKVDLPSYQTEGAAGLDLQAGIYRKLQIEPGQRLAVPTGITIAIPHGFEGQVRPRSGLALNHGITVLNAPGTIDSDYRGEIKVILHNAGGLPKIIQPGERIAQLVIAPVTRLPIEQVDSISPDETERGAGGFGSTGA